MNSTKAQSVVVDFDPLCLFKPGSNECVQVFFWFFLFFFVCIKLRLVNASMSLLVLYIYIHVYTYIYPDLNPEP